EQIQWSGESGAFLREIQVRSVSNEVVRIRNVEETWSAAALALMLYRCNPRARRIPVPVAVGADEQCPYGEPTTNIIGRDGQCVSVKDNQYNNANPIILWSCGNAQRNQLWTFKSDGTIRSNGMTLPPTLHYLDLDDADQREALIQAFPSTDYTHSPLRFAGN
nr:ribosome-inactivating protein [Tanacetum cinerariifolium]